MRGAARKTQWRACEFLRGSRIACRVACQIYLFCKRPPRCNFQLDGMLVNRHWHRQQSWQKGCDAGWRSSPSSKQRQPEGEGGVDYVGIRRLRRPLSATLLAAMPCHTGCCKQDGGWRRCQASQARRRWWHLCLPGLVHGRAAREAPSRQWCDAELQSRWHGCFPRRLLEMVCEEPLPNLRVSDAGVTCAASCCTSPRRRGRRHA